MKINTANKKYSATLIAALLCPILLPSCHSDCSNIPVNQVEILRHSRTGRITHAKPITMGLNAEEAEATAGLASSIADIFIGPRTDQTCKEQETSANIVDGIGSLSSGLSTKAGQELTIKYGRRIIYVDQPVYCRFGPLEVGQKVSEVRLLGRDVFIPR